MWDMDVRDFTFTVGDTVCAAWLYRPDGSGEHPVVVAAHGFTGTRELALDAYAERFAEAGFGVLLFDYRSFGASAGEPRQLLDIGNQLDDWREAIAAARALDWADPERVALFGSSFSGGHVVTLAAEDRRIAAIVAQCPFSDGLATLRATPVRHGLRMSGHALRDQLAALFGGSPHYVPAVADPGEPGMMTTPDAKAGMEALVPAQTTWRNQVAARIALRLPLYRPGRDAAKVACPALWCVTDHDTLCPAENTVRWARRAPRAEILRYPIGHFDIYTGEHFERAVTDQIAFLTRHLKKG
ncbi:alpha/beta fold hydrolase [Haloechinothrix sp. LS1_15]|nr:alpha/beta fold hydrolase [Haloechinothrix sp. LS1_15]